MGGPVGFLADLLEGLGVSVHRIGSREVVHSVQSFMNELGAHRLHVRPHPKLDAASKGAVKQQLGDGWKWSRKSMDVDISPLIAATLAVGRQLAAPRSVDAVPIFHVAGSRGKR